MAEKNIKIIRLFSGEEILGDVQQVTATEVVVKNVVRVMVIPSKVEAQTPQVGFVPFCHWSKDVEIKFNQQHVLAIMNPIADFVNQYNATFSGIITNTPQLIVD